MSAERVFCWRALSQKCRKALCNSARPGCAGEKAGAFLLELVERQRPAGAGMFSAGVWRGQGGIEQCSRRQNGIGWIRSRKGRDQWHSAHHIHILFLGLNCLHGSMQTCTSNIAGACLI